MNPTRNNTNTSITHLSIFGARVNNLKNVDLVLPKHKLIVIAGPSGCGKSSLAFDTLYAEGHRRYTSSLQTYAKQFVDRLPKPDVDNIEGLSPTIAIEAKRFGKTKRSTLGTLTEILDYLRVFYARAGEPHCPICARPISAMTITQMVDTILKQKQGERFTLLAPYTENASETCPSELERLQKEGFVRVVFDGQMTELSAIQYVDKTKPHSIDIVIDRLILKDGYGAKGLRARLTDSVELAARWGQGVVIYAPEGWEGKEGNGRLHFSQLPYCLDCKVFFPELTPKLFSFNHPQGACESCDGLGETFFLDEEKWMLDPQLSLEDGLVVFWAKKGSKGLKEKLKQIKKLGVDPKRKWTQYSSKEREILVSIVEAYLKATQHEDEDGDGGDDSEQAGDDSSLQPRFKLDDFYTYKSCVACKGTRLRREALSVRLKGLHLGDVLRLKIEELLQFFSDDLSFSGPSQVVKPLVSAIFSRLHFLEQVGLHYLSLERLSSTLSTGEIQRAKLAAQLGSGLSGVLYLLDEPSKGLHASDLERLMLAEKRLRDLGNTVITVEHSRDAMFHADVIVDMGPKAGKDGGQILAIGSPAELMQNEGSPTGLWLSGKKRLERRLRRTPQARLSLYGKNLDYLKDFSVSFPLGSLIGVSGVSGSGKSMLINQTLLPELQRHLQKRRNSSSEWRARDVTSDKYSPPSSSSLASPSAHQIIRLEGAHLIDRYCEVGSFPLGKSPRSIPASYMEIMPKLREIYALTPEARARGFSPPRFSFNLKGGRCETCRGYGTVKIDMHLLADVWSTCEACQGARFNRETLEIRYRGMSIADVLALRVDEALSFFEAHKLVWASLNALQKVGLGYLCLGQPGNTLSGGEAQRLKLAKELAKLSTKHCFYALDEPTSGLHFSDIELLMKALNELCDGGHTVLVVEHNLDVLASCDWVIDLGPKAGDKGGCIMCEGPPEIVAACKDSETGRHLANLLG